MKILVAEDDLHTRQGLIDILENEGYQTIAAGNGKEALALFRSGRPQLICLDIMMPDMNGYDVCKEIRKTDTTIPIVFISAKSEEVDKVLGLELGADDFIVKPFGVKEVIARIRAVTRRYLASNQTNTPQSFQMNDLTIVPAELRAYRSGSVIELSMKDVKILELMAQKKGQIVDRDQIFDCCWGMDYLPNSRSLDQHISQLRKKIELDPKHPEIIRTVHGAGYRFE